MINSEVGYFFCKERKAKLRKEKRGCSDEEAPFQIRNCGCGHFHFEADEKWNEKYCIHRSESEKKFIKICIELLRIVASVDIVVTNVIVVKVVVVVAVNFNDDL